MSWKRLLLALLIITGSALAATADMYVFAVSESGEGVAAKLTVTVVPGNGRVSLVLNSIVGEDTQRSINNALRAAAREAGVDFYDYDYTVSIESSAEYVSGPSAGLPIALTTYAALKNTDVPDWVSATGTIDEYGNVGPVGGIYAKVKAAAEKGVKLFLIPKGERYVEVPSTEEVEPGIEYPSVKREDIIVIAKREWNMDVYEVSTLHEAVLIVFEGEKPEREANESEAETPEVNFVPEPVPTRYSERFGEIVEDMLAELNQVLAKGCSDEEYSALLRTAESYRERALVVLKRGYYYTAGNYAFLGLTLAAAVTDLCEHPSLANPNSLALQLYVEELHDMLENAKARAQKYELLSSNYEWVGGARERIIRAEMTLSSPLPSDPVLMLRELKSVEYWLRSAEEMLDIADELNTGVPLKDVEEVARDEIILVEDIVARLGVPVPERVTWAKEAFHRGWYFAAFAEAVLAKGELVGENIAEEKLVEKIGELLKETEDYKGLWAELYRNHGLYYEQAAREYAKIGKEDKKMEMQRTAVTMLTAAAEFSRLAKIVSVPHVKVEVKKVTNNEVLLYVGGALLVLSLLGALLASRGRRSSEEEKTLRVLSRAVTVLTHLAREDPSGTLEKEAERLAKKVERLKKKLSEGHAPQQQSSRPSRGKRR